MLASVSTVLYSPVLLRQSSPSIPLRQHKRFTAFELRVTSPQGREGRREGEREGRKEGGRE